MCKKWTVILSVLLATATFAACGRGDGLSERGSAVPPASSVESVSESAPKSMAEPDDYFLKLTENKGELVKLVSERVGRYRSGSLPENANHHAAWPEDFPPAAQLPEITGPGDFAIRQEREIDSLGSFYLAVRAGKGYELRMTAEQFQNSEGKLEWGSGNTFFSREGDSDWESWVLSDLE